MPASRSIPLVTLLVLSSTFVLAGEMPAPPTAPAAPTTAPAALAGAPAPSLDERVKALEQKSSWTDRLSIGGEIRVRGESRDNADWYTRARDRDSQIEERAWLTTRAALADNVTVFMRLQDARVFGGETARTAAPAASKNTLENASQSNTDSQSVNLREGYIRFNDIAQTGLGATLGREIIFLGTQRYVGPGNWSSSGRSFDGLMGFWSAPADAAAFDLRLADTVKAFHYRVQDGDDTQFAGGRAGRDDNRTFTGVYNAVTLSPEEKGTQYLCDQFAFINRDRRRLFLPESGTHAGAMTSNTYGLRFGGKLAWGPHWDAEGAVQTGQWARDDLRAHTYHLEVGHVLVDMYGKPDLFLGYSFATGDHNAADGQRNTPDSLYPTSHIFYGSADRFLLQNLVEWQVAAAMTPWEEAANARSLGVKLSYHQFNLQNNADFIYLASGARFNAAPTRIPGNQIATELDLLTTFKLNGAVGIELGVAHLWPGEYVRHLIKSGGGAAPAGRGADRQMFSYLQVTAGF